MRALRTLFSAVLLALLCTPAAHARYPQAEPEEFFGLGAQRLNNLSWSAADEPKLRAHAEQIKGLGVRSVRVNQTWHAAEPSPPAGGEHTYVWVASDRLFRALAEQGIRVEVNLEGTPNWAGASGPSLCPIRTADAPAPQHRPGFAAFARAFAERYGRGGEFWAENPQLPYVPVERYEIWNEPNWSTYWCPDEDPEGYAELAALTADALRQADPEAGIVFAGLAAIERADPGTGVGMSTHEFVSRALTHRPQLRELVDEFALHIYGADAEDALSRLATHRHVLRALGLDQPIAVNEFGWALQGGAHPLAEGERAEEVYWLARSLWASDCDVSRIALHTWTSAETGLGPEGWYGLADPITGQPRQTALRYKEALQEASQHPGQGPSLLLCGGERLADPAPRPQPPHAPRRPEGFFAVDYGVLRTQAPVPRHELRRLHYEAIQGAHLRTVKTAVGWAQFEPRAPGAGHYLASEHADLLAQSAALRGMAPELRLEGWPSWLSGNLAARAEHYTRALALLAARYGKGGAFWAERSGLDPRLAQRNFTVGFSANTSQWWDGSPHPGEYSAAYELARQRLQAVNPELRALASLAAYGSPLGAGDFVRQMTVVPDGVELVADGQPWQTLAPALQDLRAALIERGAPEAPIVVRLAAPTRTAIGISEADRAERFAWITDELAAGNCGVEQVFAYAWTTPELAGQAPGDWYGLADPLSAELRATGLALSDLARSYTGWGAQPPPEKNSVICPGDPAPDAPAPEPEPEPDPEPEPEPDPEPEPEPEPALPPETHLGEIPKRVGARQQVGARIFALGAADGFICRIDAGEWFECADRLRLPRLGHGRHVLEASAYSAAAGVDPTPARAEFFVDARGPQTKLRRAGKRLFILGARAGDAARFRCRLDNRRWRNCPRRYKLPRKLRRGRHVLRVRAFDRFGNPDPRPAKRRFRLR